MASDMRPVSPGSDIRNSCLRYAVSNRKHALRLNAFSYVGYIRSGNLCLRQIAALLLARFAGHVRAVVGFGSKEQVIRSHAVRDIASVQYTQPIRNWSVNKFPCNSVSCKNAPRGIGFMQACTNLAVTKCRLKTVPKPTSIRLSDVTCEPNINWSERALVVSSWHA